MISRISGTVIKTACNYVEVSMMQGIVFQVFIPNAVNLILGNVYQFYISPYFSSEKGYTWYGFLTSAEKEYFEILCSCHGIGPKLANTILSALSPEILFSAIINMNVSLLEKINGIGPKKASYILHELKKREGMLPAINTKLETTSLYCDLVMALESIGYKTVQIKQMIDKINRTDLPKEVTLVELIQQAIHTLE